MLALRLEGDLGFAVVWVLSVCATVAGLLAWRRSGWKVGWALVAGLIGFEQVWSSVLASTGLTRVSGSPLHHAGPVPWWVGYLWRHVLGELPVFAALIAGAALAWSAQAAGNHRGHQV